MLSAACYRANPVGAPRRWRAPAAVSRAVLPQPFERVEHALLGVLHMDDHVDVVEQHPASFTLALAADRLGADPAQLLLDTVHDRPDLAVVRCGAEQKRVRDYELVADVVGDDVCCELVRRCRSGDLHELDGPWGGCHVCCSSSSNFSSCLYHRTSAGDVALRSSGYPPLAHDPA